MVKQYSIFMVVPLSGTRFLDGQVTWVKWLPCGQLEIQFLSKYVLACWSSGWHAGLTILEGSMRGFNPGQGTYKQVVKKDCVSYETKNRVPLYQNVYARASKRSHTGLHTSGKNPKGLQRCVMIWYIMEQLSKCHGLTTNRGPLAPKIDQCEVNRPHLQCILKDHHNILAHYLLIDGWSQSEGNQFTFCICCAKYTTCWPVPENKGHNYKLNM
jgi:hypothetical protein